MAVVNELIRSEADGTVSFGDYTLAEKSKKSGFEHSGDVYKVKTFKEITKLERNELFVYESVPGTTVGHLKLDNSGVSFSVEGSENAQITLELEPETEYNVTINGAAVETVKTNLGGKLVMSVEFDGGKAVDVQVTKK
ncbi:MAG: endosialidase [Lachnospiraceae bacterium]|nr:endosialidase [Lachnospiraceae bacterium]